MQRAGLTSDGGFGSPGSTPRLALMPCPGTDVLQFCTSGAPKVLIGGTCFFKGHCRVGYWGSWVWSCSLAVSPVLRALGPLDWCPPWPSWLLVSTSWLSRQTQPGLTGRGWAKAATSVSLSVSCHSQGFVCELYETVAVLR